MREREFHKKRAVKNRSHMHWVRYKEIRNKVNAELYKAKRDFFAKKLMIVPRLKILSKAGS